MGDPSACQHKKRWSLVVHPLHCLPCLTARRGPSGSPHLARACFETAAPVHVPETASRCASRPPPWPYSRKGVGLPSSTRPCEPLSNRPAFAGRGRGRCRRLLLCAAAHILSPEHSAFAETTISTAAASGGSALQCSCELVSHDFSLDCATPLRRPPPGGALAAGVALCALFHIFEPTRWVCGSHDKSKQLVHGFFHNHWLSGSRVVDVSSVARCGSASRTPSVKFAIVPPFRTVQYCAREAAARARLHSLVSNSDCCV